MSCMKPQSLHMRQAMCAWLRVISTQTIKYAGQSQIIQSTTFTASSACLLLSIATFNDNMNAIYMHVHVHVYFSEQLR